MQGNRLFFELENLNPDVEFKGFFKRSILRKEKYRCYFGDRCIVNADNRNRCKSCRFRKCLKEGMSIEGIDQINHETIISRLLCSLSGVRMGRIPKLVKEKALAEYHLSSSSTENDDFNSPLPSPTCSQSMHSINIPSNDFELQFIDDSSFLDQIDSTVFEHPVEKLPLDPSKSDVSNERIMKDTDEFSQNTLPRIGQLVKKIPQTIIEAKLNDEESSFLRYLRWTIIEISHRYNVSTRQVIERMKTMIDRGV